MKKLCWAYLLLIINTPSHAAILGPAHSDSGDFTLVWDSSGGKTLVEVDESGQRLATWTSSPTRILKGSPGSYRFEEQWCGYIPVSGYGCRAVDRHMVDVVLGNGSSPVTPALADSGYLGYFGDFDHNGLPDVFVERTAPSTPDGSLQSYVLLNIGKQQVSTVVAGDPGYDYYMSRARSFSDLRINVEFTDLNADGAADHVVPGWTLGISNNSWEPEATVIVFAPGPQVDKRRPQSATVMTPRLHGILEDVLHWADDPGFFEHNFDRRSVWQDYWAQGDPYFGYRCSWGMDWDRDTETNRWSTQLEFTCEYVPQLAEQEFLKAEPMMFAGYLENAVMDRSDDPRASLLSLSGQFQRLFGVPMFGFDTTGSWRGTYKPCGYGDPDRRYCQAASYIDVYSKALARYLRQRGGPKKDVVKSPRWTPGHDYSTDTPVCTVGEPGCTLENVACWVRHYHAPGKIGGYQKPVSNGETSWLAPNRDNAESVGGVYPGVPGPALPLLADPIRTGVGPDAGLPQHAVGNVTLPGHVFHNYVGGLTWPQCPQRIDQDGLGGAPYGCNQVYRLPVIQGGQLLVRTRGTGENAADWLNTILGPTVMQQLDRQMLDHMRRTPGMKCPSSP